MDLPAGESQKTRGKHMSFLWKTVAAPRFAFIRAVLPTSESLSIHIPFSELSLLFSQGDVSLFHLDPRWTPWAAVPSNALEMFSINHTPQNPL